MIKVKRKQNSLQNLGKNDFFFHKSSRYYAVNQLPIAFSTNLNSYFYSKLPYEQS